jgi:uncharacterized metal-binding protein YceD (DUF177 family)
MSEHFRLARHHMTSSKTNFPPPLQATQSHPELGAGEDGYDAGFGHKSVHQVSDLSVSAFDLDFLLRHGAAHTFKLTSSHLPRLAKEQVEISTPNNLLEAKVQLKAWQTVDASGARSRFLEVIAHTELMVPCGRCLQPVQAHIGFEGDFLLVASEDLAQEMDSLEEPQDVICAAQFLRADRLVEDELLMAMAPAYWHENCESQAASAPERRNPFAALAALKKPS